MKTGKMQLASEVAKYGLACSIAGIIISEVGEKIQKPYVTAVGLGSLLGGIFVDGFAVGLCVTIEDSEDNR